MSQSQASEKVSPSSLLRTILIVVLLILLTGGGVFFYSEYQDQRQRQAEVAALHERERHALEGRPPTAENFYPIEAVPRPSIVRGFKIVTAIQVAGAVRDDEIVLGVNINGHSRAYPLNVLTGPSREVFNDTLGGRAIAATW